MVLYNCPEGDKRTDGNVPKRRIKAHAGRGPLLLEISRIALDRAEKENVIMAIEKFCTRCGKKFVAVGREVICPACKESAKEEAKKAAVLRAKRASWSGESVPVRISGRASTYVRAWAARRGLTFAESLDSLLQLSESISCIGEMWKDEKWHEWQDITPYKSRRLKKSSTDAEQEKAEQEVKQNKLAEAPTSPAKPAVQAAKANVKGTAKKTASKASKTSKKEEVKK